MSGRLGELIDTKYRDSNLYMLDCWDRTVLLVTAVLVQTVAGKSLIAR